MEALTWNLLSQIGDLLAEISGEKPSPLPKAPPSSSSSSGIKRKADSSNGDAAKVSKARHTDGSASKITRNAQGDVIGHSRSTPHPVTPAYTGTSARKSSPQPQRTSLASTNGSRPSVANGQSASANGKAATPTTSNLAQRRPVSDIASRPKLNPSSSAAKVPPTKPSPTTPTASDPARAPKKGSFAEIMARGAKAQQVMGKVGVIQHKATEKPAVNRKERDVTRPGAKTPAGKSYMGNARPIAVSRDAARSGGQGRDMHRNSISKDGKQSGKQRPISSGGEGHEKKLKKAATATTGYTGTARPRPNANKSSSARSGKPQAPGRAGGLLAPPKSSRRDRLEEEYDEELDDFIDYDEEDEPDPRGHGYGYDSDGSSDMEAGLTDIDAEERRATFAAIQEDKREQALEEKLRREKEERRKRLGR